MRFIVSVLMLMLLSSHAVADDVQAPSAVALQAARAMSETFTDEALVAEITDATIERRQHEFRTPLLTGPFYENLRPDTQRSLREFVDTMPQIVHEEVRASMAAVREDLTQRFIARFSETQLAAIGPLFAHPRFRASVLASARAEVRGQPDPETPADPELEALFASATANGAPSHLDILQVVNESSAAVQARFRPQTEQRFLRGICAAMADECPAHVRRLIAAAPAN